MMDRNFKRYFATATTWQTQRGGSGKAMRPACFLYISG
jgi:hypothetical protein